MTAPPGLEAGLRLTRRDALVRGSLALAVSAPLLGRVALADVTPGAVRPRRCAVGAFADPGGEPTVASSVEAVAQFESLIRHRVRIASTFVAWEEPFPNQVHVRHRDAGRRSLIAWDGLEDLRRIRSGRWDSLLRRQARACRDFGAPIYLRWAAEFNGEWNPCYGRPRQFVAAWRHLVRTFRDEGATNVRWVWCPFAVDERRRAADDWRRYYPGRRYVDWVGIDGYNWGSARPWSRWQSFREIFAPVIRDYAGRRPVMICEVGCAERGGDKAAWVRDMGAQLAGPCSAVRALVWFHADKETDWRVSSSASSLAAFRSVVAARRYG
jgi:mannan endo-1,4-beta-mannosidase